MNKNSPYYYAAQHAAEVADLAQDLRRAIAEADAGTRSDSDLDQITSELDRHLKAIDERSSTPKDRTADELNAARQAYDDASRTEGTTMEEYYKAESRAATLRAGARRARTLTDAAHARLEEARRNHNAAANAPR